MRLPIVLMMLLLGLLCCRPADKIDYNDPERIQALEDIYYHMDENLPVYTIKTDTLGVWPPHTIVLELTVLKNGEAVYDEVRYENLCPG